ncbi:MAG: alanine racemase, partial [Caldisericum exile]
MENEIEMNRPTWVEVDLEAIKNNFLRIQEKVSSKSVICVVKADAYGLGASKIASTLEEVGASAFAVASMEEALSLRDSQIKKPILVLGYVDTRNLHLASLNEIRITLFDKDFLKRINDYKNETPLKIHVKIDTGMHRLGISLTELPSVFEELN